MQKTGSVEVDDPVVKEVALFSLFLFPKSHNIIF